MSDGTSYGKEGSSCNVAVMDNNILWRLAVGDKPTYKCNACGKTMDLEDQSDGS
jgi:hypothetical protein